jgi:vancomycin resistance protein VanJ
MPRAGRRILRALAALCWLYVCALVLLAVLWLAAPTAAWWLALSNIFAPHLFTPLVLLLPLALLLRHAALHSAALALGALFVLLCGPSLLPYSPRAGAEGRALRVLTLNQHRPNRRFEELMAAIRAQDADLVALQELTPATVVHLEAALADVYPYRIVAPSDVDDSGLGLLSRYPLRPLEAPPGLVALAALAEVEGMTVRVLTTHLASPTTRADAPESLPALPIPSAYDTRVRDAEVARLLSFARGSPGPLLLLGDFNLADREPAYALLAAELRDSFRAAAWGFGFTFPDTKRLLRQPYPYPLIRIDYVWSRELTPLAAWTACGQSKSDHCAVVAVLALPS